LEAKDVLPNKPHEGRRNWGRKMPFLSMVILILKLIRAREPNTSSLWIWRKST